MSATSAGTLPANGPAFTRSWARGRAIEKLVGADRRKIPYDEVEPEQAPEYVEGRRYSKYELSLMADELLAGQHLLGHPVFLTKDQLKQRRKREIYVSTGIPDPSVTSGLYWRTHPQGRKVNSDEQRQKNGSGFYR